jgi:ATP-dependent exoDNAse (exonuclease V) beta subunit
MRDSYYLEREIDELTYPAKLSTPVKRLLAAKLRDLQNANATASQALHQEANSASQRKLVEMKDLPRAAKPLAKKMLKLEAARQQLKSALKAHSVEAGYDNSCFYVETPAAEVEKVRAATQAKLSALGADYQKAQEDLKATALKLAAAEIANIKAKIAKANPQLVEELDSIGQRLLPPAEEPKPVKALKGKTQKAAANEAVHPSTRD